MVGWGSTRLAGGVYARAGSPPKRPPPALPPALPPPPAAADAAAAAEARYRNMGAELAYDMQRHSFFEPR